MPTTITLTRTYSDFANIPDDFDVGNWSHDEPGEPLAMAQTYILPDGYHVGIDGMGQRAIYRDGSKLHCPLVMHRPSRLPQIVDNLHTMPVLKRAP